MTTQQPEALQCAADLEYSIARHGMQDAFTLNAYRAMKMVRTQQARIADLEAQLEAIGAGGVSGPLIGQPQAMPDLSQLTERGAKAWAGVDARGLREGFTAADMATVGAQGFRDGVASLTAQAVVQDDLITIRKPTTSAEMLWLLKLAHLVISDVGKTLEETFSPAQPAAEVSRFGSPELQAMIIARCVEKDQADSVPAVSDLPPLPAPDLRDVGTKPQEIKEFLKGYATEYARTAIAARAPADSVQEDAALWHWLAEYLVGTRTDLDDEIVASETVNDLRKLVKAAIKQGEKQ